MWDLSILQVVPHIRLAAPRDAPRLREELREAIAVGDAPTVLRFPKGSISPVLDAVRRTPDGADVLAEAAHKDVLIVSVGTMAELAMEVRDRLADQGIGSDRHRSSMGDSGGSERYRPRSRPPHRGEH